MNNNINNNKTPPKRPVRALLLHYDGSMTPMYESPSLNQVRAYLGGGFTDLLVSAYMDPEVVISEQQPPSHLNQSKWTDLLRQLGFWHHRSTPIWGDVVVQVSGEEALSPSQVDAFLDFRDKLQLLEEEEDYGGGSR
jgi:hypothetical protein